MTDSKVSSSTAIQAARPRPSGLRENCTDPDLNPRAVGGVVGTKGDSPCYMGVMARSMPSIQSQEPDRQGSGP